MERAAPDLTASEGAACGEGRAGLSLEAVQVPGLID